MADPSSVHNFDILTHVFSCIDPYNKADREACVNASRVCRAWSVPASTAIWDARPRWDLLDLYHILFPNPPPLNTAGFVDSAEMKVYLAKVGLSTFIWRYFSAAYNRLDILPGEGAVLRSSRMGELPPLLRTNAGALRPSFGHGRSSGTRLDPQVERRRNPLSLSVLAHLDGKSSNRRSTPVPHVTFFAPPEAQLQPPTRYPPLRNRSHPLPAGRGVPGYPKDGHRKRAPDRPFPRELLPPTLLTPQARVGHEHGAVAAAVERHLVVTAPRRPGRTSRP